MNRIATFKKITFEQFEKDFADCCAGKTSTTAEEAYEAAKKPVRATAGSAGYDLISTVSFKLEPGESIKIPTAIRVQMDEGWVLLILPKSGLGSKFRFQLDNTCGVIDSDYYYAANQGHIMVPMTNDSKSGKTLEIPAGKAFAQAIFVPYGICIDDEAEGARTGGFGSTGV